MKEKRVNTLFPNLINRLFTDFGIFIFSFCTLFILYLPAAKAGFVTDFTGWLEDEKTHSFLDIINRTYYHGQSFYQVTQFNTYLFYKLLGVNTWYWHILFLTIHSINTVLLFKLGKYLCHNTGIKEANTIVFIAILLFNVSPYLSEVVIWEPSYHFLQGLFFILLILNWLFKYWNTGNKKYALWAFIVYFLSTFSLEIFYITPWLVLVIYFYLRFNSAGGLQKAKNILSLFFIPQLLLFAVHIVAIRWVYGGWVAHIGTNAVVAAPFTGLGKPAKYIFHLLFLGRFFTTEYKNNVYAFCDSNWGVIAFYTLLATIMILVIIYFKKMNAKCRLLSLVFSLLLITTFILIPLWFSTILLVYCDRYLYFAEPFFYILISIIFSFISVKSIKTVLIFLFTVVNLRFAIQVSRYWGKSERVIAGLHITLPDEKTKTILLLNIPECMNGVPMLGAEKESEFKLIHNLLFTNNKITTPLYDCMAYNMLSPTDGANVIVLNDSTVKVTLNQWGTWWWYATQGGISYENTEYKLNLKDVGHYYELTLKKPANKYVLLYQVGDKWKKVDWSVGDKVQE